MDVACSRYPPLGTLIDFEKKNKKETERMNKSRMKEVIFRKHKSGSFPKEIVEEIRLY